MPYYTFYNVTIAVQAENGEEAYTKLCNQLAKNEGDWWTDTFMSDTDLVAHSTEELFPKQP